MKSLYDNLKQKEGEGSKAGKCNANRGFHNFRKRLGLKNVEARGEAASADQEEADEFPDTTAKIENRYPPEQVFNGDERVYSRKKCQKGHLLAGKRSEHQDLRQEKIN